MMDLCLGARARLASVADVKRAWTVRLMGVDVQLLGLATCQNTHGGPFVAEGSTSLLGS